MISVCLLGVAHDAHKYLPLKTGTYSWCSPRFSWEVKVKAEGNACWRTDSRYKADTCYVNLGNRSNNKIVFAGDTYTFGSPSISTVCPRQATLLVSNPGATYSTRTTYLCKVSEDRSRVGKDLWDQGKLALEPSP